MGNLTKQRTTVWLYPETFKKIDNAVSNYDLKSRSEFIEKAVDFYIGYLNSVGSTAYLSEHILGAIDGTLKNTENRISANIFRLSVEMSVMMNVLGEAVNGVDDEWIKETRAKCIRQIKKSRGKVSFEENLNAQIYDD